MIYSKLKSKGVLLTAVAIVAVVVAFFLFRATPAKKAGPNKPTNTQSASAPQTSLTYVETADFKYSKPSGWAKLSQDVLSKNAAVSGIGLLDKPVFFTVQVNTSTPGSDADLKNSTLGVLKKLPSFQLLSTEPTKLDGQNGEEFTYLTNAKPKTRSEMITVVHNKKTFFLLFSAVDNDFSAHQSDFTTIENSFKFK